MTQSEAGSCDRSAPCMKGGPGKPGPCGPTGQSENSDQETRAGVARPEIQWLLPPGEEARAAGARGDRGARREAVREERAGLESPRSGVTRCLTRPHTLLLGGVRAAPVAPWGLMAAKCWNHWTPRPGSAPRQATPGGRAACCVTVMNPVRSPRPLPCRVAPGGKQGSSFPNSRLPQSLLPRLRVQVCEQASALSLQNLPVCVRRGCSSALSLDTAHPSPPALNYCHSDHRLRARTLSSLRPS